MNWGNLEACMCSPVLSYLLADYTLPCPQAWPHRFALTVLRAVNLAARPTPMQGALLYLLRAMLSQGLIFNPAAHAALMDL